MIWVIKECVMGSIKVKIDADFKHSDINYPPSIKEIKISFMDGGQLKTLNLKEILDCNRCLSLVHLQDKHRYQNVSVVFNDGKEENKMPLIEFVEGLHFSKVEGEIRLQNSGYQAVSEEDYVVIKEDHKDGSWVNTYVPISDFVENPFKQNGGYKYKFSKNLNTREKRLRFLTERTGLPLHGKWGTLLAARDEWRSKKRKGVSINADLSHTTLITHYLAKVSLAMLGQKVQINPKEQVSVNLRPNGDIDIYLITSNTGHRIFEFRVDGQFTYTEWEKGNNEKPGKDIVKWIDPSLIIRTQDWLTFGGPPDNFRS